MKQIILIAGLVLSSSVFAGDIDAGKKVAVTCAACHGANGISANALWPNLAGQKEGYLAKQLKAFKSGDRKDPIMGSMAGRLSEADIANVSAYFASLK